MLFRNQLKPVYTEAVRILRLTANRHDVPKKTTPDLKDVQPNWDYIPGGGSAMSLLLPQDFERGVDSPTGPILSMIFGGLILAATLVIALLLAGTMALSHADPMTISAWFIRTSVALILGLSVASAFVIGTDAIMAFVIALSTIPTIGIVPAVIAFIHRKPKGDYGLWKTRDEVLLNQSLIDTANIVYGRDWEDVCRIKEKQAALALEDKTPFIDLGVATGHLRRHEDPFAPDKDGQIGLTVNDLSMHLAVMGKTGTGKTVLITKIIRQFCEKTDAGMFVMCGKGTLPGDLKLDDPSYTLLSPETAKLALFQGMSAPEVVDALAASQPEGGSGKFFIDNAKEITKNSAVILKALHDAGDEEYRFTPTRLKRLITANGGEIVGEDGEAKFTPHAPYRAEALRRVAAIEKDSGKLVDQPGLVKEAFLYFLDVLPQKMRSKSFNDILSTVDTFFAPLYQNDAIAGWADLAEGEDISAVLRGKRIGLNVPAVKYGQAAASIVANLVRQRLYSALKLRGNGWKSKEGESPVLLVIDEMHLLWQADSGDGMDDNSMVSIARSLGGTFLVGTQSLDEMESRFGHDKTLASLGNFRNFVSYEATSKTLDYASSRVGPILRPLNTIDNERGEYPGVLRFVAQQQEYLAPRSLGGDLGKGAAKLYRKKILQNPINFLIPDRLTNAMRGGVGDDGNPETSEQQKGFGNAARATYPAATEDELQIMLHERFTAIAVLNRAGAPRRDVIRVEP